MKYDFSKLIDRTNTSCFKFDAREKIFGKADVIPMWVADMDFATPPFIIEKMSQRLKHPVFGYTFRDDEFSDAIRMWMSKRHGWSIDNQWISFAPGIVAGLYHAVQAFTNQGDKVLIQSPVYHPFYYAARQNGRRLVTNPLIQKDGKYSIDFNHFEDQIKKGVKLFILCSPHNPVGRVWHKEELIQMAEICLKYNVLIVSDEIHADLIFHPHKHIPLATLSPEIANQTITFNSASKTFNIAGLTTAYAIISNPQYLKTYNQQLEKNGTNHGNIFGFESLKAAYSPQGEEWLEQLLHYVKQSVDNVDQYLKKNLPKIKLIYPEGTYLLWIDFRELGIPVDKLTSIIVNEAGLGFNSGEIFGPEGQGFQRMNIGCPHDLVNESLNRLAKVFTGI